MMKIDLVQHMKDFDYQKGLSITGYLDEAARLIGRPYVRHEFIQNDYVTQTMISHYCTPEFDIYQDRFVRYSMNSRETTEVKHELIFAGEDEHAKRFLDDIMKVLKDNNTKNKE